MKKEISNYSIYDCGGGRLMAVKYRITEFDEQGMFLGSVNAKDPQSAFTKYFEERDQK